MSDLELMQKLIQIANERHGGHLTIYKFTSNWRVSFVTPQSRDDISRAAAGKTFAEAAIKALGSYLVPEGEPYFEPGLFDKYGIST
jgi:hypothetical protein